MKMRSESEYIENFRYLENLPIVKQLIQENDRLRRRNKELKNLVRLISGNVSLFSNK